jgi:hypothetical protein
MAGSISWLLLLLLASLGKYEVAGITDAKLWLCWSKLRLVQCVEQITCITPAIETVPLANSPHATAF